MLSANTGAEDHLFWEDSLSIERAVEYAGPRLLGHQQVTDAYLLGLAIRRRGILATLDHGVNALLDKNSDARKALEVVVSAEGTPR